MITYLDKLGRELVKEVSPSFKHSSFPREEEEEEEKDHLSWLHP